MISAGMANPFGDAYANLMAQAQNKATGSYPDEFLNKLRREPYNPQYDALYRQYGITPAEPVKPAWSPDVGGQFAKSTQDLDAYQRELSGFKGSLTSGPQMIDPLTGEKTTDLSAGLRSAGAYQEQDYMYNPELFQYNAPKYQGTTFQNYDTFKKQAPGEYQETEYDFADQYQAPDEYQAFQYTAPEIAEIERVQPVADEIWGQRAAAEQEAIGQQYADTRDRMKQAAVQTAARPEQMAALEANLGIEQSKANTAAQRALDIERANQAVGIAQTEQGLQASRASQQAGFDAQQQEAQAQEMAKKYGLDVDAARYIVQQQSAQQQAQAAENQAGFTANLGRAKELAGQQLAQQQAQQGEYQYRTQKEADDAKFQLGLKQAQAEARQAEYEKAYQSRYGLAQDTAQTALAQDQARKAAQLDYLNANLQGQQARSQNAAQQATYQTNLSEDERNKAAEAQKTYQAQMKDYNAGKVNNPVTINFKQQQQAAAKKQDATIQ